MFVRILLILIVVGVIAAIVWAQMRTWEMEKRPNQAIFAGGTETEPVVGKYTGEAGGR